MTAVFFIGLSFKMEIIYWIKNRTVSEFSIIWVPESKGLEYQENRRKHDSVLKPVRVVEKNC